MKDPYLVLGLPKTASEDEIKKAYRRLAKKHHPDLNQGNKESETKFKELSEAYEQVGSAEARAKFDNRETDDHDTRRYAQDLGQARDGADFFENLFRRSSAQPGEDHLYQLDVDFKDAALGGERELSLPTGKKLLVKIPPGISTGTKLRFKNQGGLGNGSGPAGDAYVEISVKALPGFSRVGNNIETELPLSFQEAILGAEVKAATIEGSILLKVPPGSSTGSRLRIRGKGIGREGARGDQIAIIKIVLPKKIDLALQEAIRNLGPQFSYDPRRP